MDIPKLNPEKRAREYNLYSEYQRIKAVEAYLFKNLSHRKIDTEILGLDSEKSKGYQSMGILHHLGLKREFKGIFSEYPYEFALEIMKQKDDESYRCIIEIVEKLNNLKKNNSIDEEKENTIIQYMLISDKDFEKELKITDEPRQVEKSLYLSFLELPKRNLKILSNAIHYSGFLCEVNNSHPTFISKVTEKNYVEGHHLIPLSKQKYFINSLDTESNIVALCPRCHKIFHHGKKETKEELIELIYNIRKSRLKNSGIEVQLEKLKEYYE